MTYIKYLIANGQAEYVPLLSQNRYFQLVSNRLKIATNFLTGAACLVIPHIEPKVPETATVVAFFSLQSSVYRKKGRD